VHSFHARVIAVEQRAVGGELGAHAQVELGHRQELHAQRLAALEVRGDRRPARAASRHPRLERLALVAHRLGVVRDRFVERVGVDGGDVLHDGPEVDAAGAAHQHVGRPRAEPVAPEPRVS
jgi:hypothetical protein